MRVVDDRLYKWDAPLGERQVLRGVQPDHNTLLAIARRELAADDGVTMREGCARWGGERFGS